MHAGLVNSSHEKQLIRELENRDRKEKKMRKRKHLFVSTNNIT